MADGYAALVTPPRRARALFVSDLHLGTRACRADRLLSLLEGCEADTLYLVGDVVDGWRLKARWYWPPSHDAIVRCLLRKQQSGTRVLYIPGNHDAFLRHSIGLRLGGIEVVSDAIHEAADGQQYLVVHGDAFDPIVHRMRYLTALGIWIYAGAILFNDACHRWRRRLGYGAPARRAAHIRAFEHAVVAEARRRQVQGVICGHIHRPTIHERLGLRYINTGDWVDACTAVIEHHDGAFELLRWPFDTNPVAEWTARTVSAG